MYQRIPSRLSAVVAVGMLAGFTPSLRAETVVTESAGTISEFTPEALVIRTETNAAPTRYVMSKEVTYVDDAGAPVSVEVVKSGLPVTVHYVREGDREVARRVVVHRAREVRGAAVEERRTEVRRPVVEERRTEVSTPVVEERRTVVRTPVVTAPIIERKTITTTTTTSDR